jgi:hypothetical protein
MHEAGGSMMRPDQIEGALTLLISVLAGALTVATYAFTHFQTQDEANRTQEIIERRLERIESKLDKLFEHGR